MTSFLLKIIGMILMLFDHVGDAIVGHFTWFNLVGRIAFPIFAFQSVQGYIHTHDLKKHFIKLFIFAIIAQIPFMLFLSLFSTDISLNIFFTFLLGLIAIFCYDKCKNKFCGFLLVLLLSIIGQLIHVDYGMYGILLMFIFYLFKDKKLLICFFTISIIIFNYTFKIIKSPSSIITYLNCILFTCLSLVPICLYNKQEGPKCKYLFYIFYPLHLLILYFISIFI